MNYNELIEGYLDGTLSPAEEEQLFTALSSSEELRTELKQSIAMDKELNKRVSAFVPTSAATMSIFTQLGIGTAAGATAGAAAGAALAGKGTLISFLAAHSTAIISSLVAIALTAGSFLAFYNPPDENAVTSNTQQEQQINYLNNSHNNQVPVVISLSTDRESSTPARVDTVIRYVTRETYGDKITDDFNTEPKQEITSEQEKDEDIALLQWSETANATQLQSDYGSALMYPSLSQAEYSPMEISYDNKKKGISFEVKGNGYWAIPAPDVPIYEAPALANMQLSALYSFSDKFKAGVDLRQENFYQKFRGTNEIGEEFEYKQYPNYYTISLMGRYSFWSNQMVGTFAQGTLGGTATGGVGRLMLGLELSPYSNLSFLLGIEGSMLIYQHQNNIFTSPKIGLSYGVAFNF